jgi:hypothetical protein
MRFLQAGHFQHGHEELMKTIASAIAAFVLVLALATTAYGQTSIDGYNDSGGQIQNQVDQGGTGGSSGSDPVSATPSATADDGGSLPFTGLDAALLAAGGGVLLAAGIGMRRLTRASA